MKQNSTAKEQSLNPQPAVHIESKPTVSADQLDERLLSALHAASEKKALDVVV